MNEMKKTRVLHVLRQDKESKVDEKYTSWGHDDETMSWDDFIELRKRCVQLDVHDKK